MRRHQIWGQGRLIDREAVILAGDEHAPARELLHRVIGTVMAELHFDGTRAAGEAEQLMTQADAEDRYLALEQLAEGLDRVIARLGIAGTVREEHSVGIQREHFLSGERRRYHRHAAALIG